MQCISENLNFICNPTGSPLSVLRKLGLKHFVDKKWINIIHIQLLSFIRNHIKGAQILIVVSVIPCFHIYISFTTPNEQENM